MRGPGVNGLSDYGDKDEAFPALSPPHSPGQGGPDDGDPFANGEGRIFTIKKKIQCKTE